MQREPADIWKPAIISGAIFGTCSGIPYLQVFNYACCSLIVGSGFLACYMMVKSGAPPVTWGRAALGGAASGAIAALVSSMTSVLVMAALGTTFEENLQKSLDEVSKILPSAGETADILARVPSTVFLIGGMFFSVILFAPFGAIGGVIARALFEKRVAPPPDAPGIKDTAGGPPAGGLDI